MVDEKSTPAVAVGERRVVRILDIAFGGEGVAREGEFVIFVPFVITGEEVEVEITEVKKNFARAKLLKVFEASPERVEARCPYFGACGGCQYQHMSYGEQLRSKRKQIADLFARVGKFPEAVVEEIAGSPKQYEYRNRIMIRSQWNKQKQGLEIGFIRYDNRWVEDIEFCPIAEPEVSAKIAEVRRNPPPKGGLKVVLRRLPEDWEVPHDSFFQNNFYLLPELVETARRFLREAGTRFLIDVYCGVGFFGIELAGLVERVLGVEMDKRAIRAAGQNAERRGLKNAEFRFGDANEMLPGLLREFPSGETTVLLDPPRTGVPAGSLQVLREVRAKQILYVSCHPATLARDLNILCRDGVYQLKRVKPLDMFPQTQHAECVAELCLGAEKE